jgi:hypothetical protein
VGIALRSRGGDGTIRTICFFSDFGYTDDFAGVCRAVISRLAPEIRVIDITHGLRQRDVLGGAVVLRNTLPYLPERAVHLAVVDPGVGGPRRAVALQSADDRVFVGPDNGLLTLAADAAGGVRTAMELTNDDLWLSPVSRTFHGRDIFSPVAALLASATPLHAVGQAIDPAGLVRVAPPAPRRRRDGVECTVVLVDGYGNLALGMDETDLRGLWRDGPLEIVRGDTSIVAHLGDSFSSVPHGQSVLLMDSYDQVSLAVNGGSAAARLGVETGDEVLVRPLTR